MGQRKQERLEANPAGGVSWYLTGRQEYTMWRGVTVLISIGKQGILIAKA